MKTILFKLLDRAADLIDFQPVLALFIGAALLAVFLTALFAPRSAAEPGDHPSLLWRFSDLPPER